jgi:hypothetical protein
MATPSMGHQSKLGIDSASPVTKQFDFKRCTIGKQATLINHQGMRGSRSHVQNVVAAGPYTVGGLTLMDAKPDDLDLLLPAILGAAEASDVFALAETLPVRTITVDKVAKVATYAGMKVNRATFRAARETLELEIDWQGKTETIADAGTFPSIAASLSNQQPYVYHQGVLTVDGAAIALKNVEVTIDNALLLDGYNNSQSRSHLPEGDRIITLTCDAPYTSDETAFYDFALAGAAGTLVYTHPTNGLSLTFSFANLKVPTQVVAIASRTGEIPLRLPFQAFMSGSTRELIVTNDNTL